ncbi:proton channel OtopLc-like isoform X1 [Anneissia japonica]|uniref:proton channel OtopLc-like isoform X1 n=1 Tax=Anneissia japonica TaxID=1529436 RepID=UPI0014259236|nr:proton channel OtopLc-like isoform X1 [Anneissia japonica]
MYNYGSHSYDYSGGGGYNRNSFVETVGNFISRTKKNMSKAAHDLMPSSHYDHRNTSLELSLRFPHGSAPHIIEDHGYGGHGHEEDEDPEDVWSALSSIHCLIVVILAATLDMAYVFLKFNTDYKPVTLEHVEGYFIFLYLVSLTWLILVPIAKRPLPDTADEERWDLHASNKYVNVGLLFFGCGGCLWAIMRTALYVELGEPCYSNAMAFGSILSVTFTMLQIYFFWRFSSVCLVRWTPLCRMALMHLVATNLSIWIRTLIEETWEDFLVKTFKFDSYGGGYSSKKEKGGEYGAEKTAYLYGSAPYTGEKTDLFYGSSYNSTNQTTELYQCDKGEGLSKAVYYASKYLYSFTVEYSIMAAGLAYVMWQNINRRIEHSHDHHAPHTNHDYTFSFECGLLLGVLTTMCGVIILILNIIYTKDVTKKDMSFETYHGYRIFLNIICSIACGMAFYGIYKGGWKYEHVEGPMHHFDVSMLFLCVAGSFLQSLFTFVAAVATLGTYQHAGLLLFDEMTHMAQTVIQMVLMLAAMSRKPPEDFKETRTKQILMFLLVCNVAWWILCSYELKGGYDLFEMENEYYGSSAWYVVIHLAAPLEILFRFHSTACFFEIWSTGKPSEPEH